MIELSAKELTECNGLFGYTDTVELSLVLLVSLDTSDNSLYDKNIVLQHWSLLMPTIRIEDDVYEGLKSIAQPFSDTPNTVIRRLLEERGKLTGSDKAAMQDPDNNSGNPKKQKLASQSIYETFLLYVLWIDFHGRASKKEVTNAVIMLMKSHGFITDGDLEAVSTGETRAENTIAWARNALKDRGLISRLSARGVWELTPDGVEKAKQAVLPAP